MIPERVGRVLLFGSPFFAAVMTLGLGVAAMYFGPGPWDAAASFAVPANAVLAAFGSGAGGMMERGGTVQRVIVAVLSAFFGFLVYAGLGCVGVTALLFATGGAPRPGN